MSKPPLILNVQPHHRENSRKAAARRAEENRKKKESDRDIKQGWGWKHNYKSATNNLLDRSSKARARRQGKMCDMCGKHKCLERRNQCRMCYNEAHQSNLHGYGKRNKKYKEDLDPCSAGTILSMSDKTKCPYPGCNWFDFRRGLRLHLKTDHPSSP